MWLDGLPFVPQQETAPANSTFVLPKNSNPETEKSAEDDERNQLDNNVECDLFTDDDSDNEVSFSAFCDVAVG